MEAIATYVYKIRCSHVDKDSTDSFQVLFFLCRRGGNYKQNKIMEHALNTAKTAQRQAINHIALVCQSISLHLCAVLEVVKLYSQRQALVHKHRTRLVIKEHSKTTKELDAHNYLKKGCISCTRIHLKTLEVDKAAAGCTVGLASLIKYAGYLNTSCYKHVQGMR